MRRTLFFALITTAVSPNVLRAQGECTAPKNSNVAKMLAWFDGPLAFALLMPRFQVGFTSRNGFVDNTKVRVDLTRVSLFGGLAYAIAKSVDLSAQLYSAPQDATTLRAGISWRLR